MRGSILRDPHRTCRLWCTRLSLCAVQPVAPAPATATADTRAAALVQLRGDGNGNGSDETVGIFGALITRPDIWALELGGFSRSAVDGGLAWRRVAWGGKPGVPVSRRWRSVSNCGMLVVFPSAVVGIAYSVLFGGDTHAASHSHLYPREGVETSLVGDVQARPHRKVRGLLILYSEPP